MRPLCPGRVCAQLTDLEGNLDFEAELSTVHCQSCLILAHYIALLASFDLDALYYILVQFESVLLYLGLPYVDWMFVALYFVHCPVGFFTGRRLRLSRLIVRAETRERWYTRRTRY